MCLDIKMYMKAYQVNGIMNYESTHCRILTAENSLSLFTSKFTLCRDLPFGEETLFTYANFK